jgi:hypothetical protein
LFTAYFWKSALERALKSFAQALLAVVGAGQLGVLDVSWRPALSTAAMAAVLSVLTSMASARVGAPDDPSLLKDNLDGAGVAPITPQHAAASV